MNQVDNFAQACPPRPVLCVEWKARVCVDMEVWRIEMYKNYPRTDNIRIRAGDRRES